MVGERRDFIFGGQVDHIKLQPIDNKPSLKGAWSHHIFLPTALSVVLLVQCVVCLSSVCDVLYCGKMVRLS